ncbi:unnamed protein product [Effrenium voratum]|uniref:SET domain-containing protein n=1 Tax=Effrenium voratum TaxID=2562239 RepID=A0AA36JJH0_9DINO|nr:unnamed protein product [Effrenium voratum]CAJ1407372.1 unnamed protein product [Effrenium voratum]CAJ1429364.1 unnamed protein product [Effrenium voratum]
MRRCTVGRSKVEICHDVESKGVCLRAVENVEPGETLLTELPLLSTPAAQKLAARQCTEAFCARLPKQSPEDQIVVCLAKRWIPVLYTFAEAAADVKEAVLSLQTDFAVPDSSMAQMVERLSTLLHSSGLFSGSLQTQAALSKRDIRSVLGLMIINAADTMPDGSEAVFYMGAIIEHSCSPNTKFCIQSCDAKEASKLLGKGSETQMWIGEWRATEAIKRGEAVTTSYLEPELLQRCASERRRVLRARMGFECACASCASCSDPAKLVFNLAEMD